MTGDGWAYYVYHVERSFHISPYRRRGTHKAYRRIGRKIADWADGGRSLGSSRGLDELFEGKGAVWREDISRDGSPGGPRGETSID